MTCGRTRRLSSRYGLSLYLYLSARRGAGTAQGAAFAAREAGIACTVFMWATANPLKIEATRGYGADVDLSAADPAEAHDRLLAYVEETGRVFVHPFDDPHVAAGQGTVALEMLEDAPEIDCFAVPIGGGGLISGISTVARALKPEAKIIGVQAELFPSMYNVIKGTNLPIGGDTLAEGIAVKYPGDLTRTFVRDLVDDIQLVGERHLEESVSLLLQIEKTVVEGAGAAGLAALLKEPARYAGQRVGLVLCGGNIDPLLLAAIIERGMVRAGRLARIRVGARDAPGVLARITAIVAEAGANIDEVQHQRAFSSLSVERAQIEVVVHTRGVAHIEHILGAMRDQGYQAERIG